jgi:hypothetical protein
MRNITTVAGSSVALDGDVLAILETISRDLARQHALEYGFEDVERAIAHLVVQLTEDELRAYLKESLFMSFNRFDADRMTAILRKAIRTAESE